MEQLKLKEGVIYQTLRGRIISIRRFSTANPNHATFTDGWVRHISGPFIGRYCGKEEDDEYGEHIDVAALLKSKPRRHVQLTLL